MAVWRNPGGLSFGVVMLNSTISLPLQFNNQKAQAHIATADKADVARYLADCKRIKPETDEDLFWLYIFALLSVHTTWKCNLRGFTMLKELGLKNFTARRIRNRLVKAGCGLSNNRAAFIMALKAKFWRGAEGPREYRPKSYETLTVCRDRLAKEIYGLGLTKTSFVLEMIFPESCEIVCLDTHILKLYGHRTGTPGYNRYRDMERDWATGCAQRKLPSPPVRNMFWDPIQGFTNMRYWSYVLEKKEKPAA
jgi:thermostable 8-oxoguanine DNA glycosylase